MRSDDYWIDFESEFPYPLSNFGENVIDFVDNLRFDTEVRGLRMDDNLVRVKPELINPYAVGHIVNHPPPDVPANVKLIDFDMPYTFFPSYMARYLPVMDKNDRQPHSPLARIKKENETRRNDNLRSVALIALTSIADGEELYVDYLDDRRAEINYAPDWLIKPPRLTALLEKKEMTTYLPFAVKLLLSWEMAKQGEKYEDFINKTKSGELHVTEELKKVAELESKGENPLPGKRLSVADRLAQLEQKKLEEKSD